MGYEFEGLKIGGERQWQLREWAGTSKENRAFGILFHGFFKSMFANNETKVRSAMKAMANTSPFLFQFRFIFVALARSNLR